MRSNQVSEVALMLSLHTQGTILHSNESASGDGSRLLQLLKKFFSYLREKVVSFFKMLGRGLARLKQLPDNLFSNKRQMLEARIKKLETKLKEAEEANSGLKSELTTQTLHHGTDVAKLKEEHRIEVEDLENALRRRNTTIRQLEKALAGVEERVVSVDEEGSEQETDSQARALAEQKARLDKEREELEAKMVAEKKKKEEEERELVERKRKQEETLALYEANREAYKREVVKVKSGIKDGSLSPTYSREGDNHRLDNIALPKDLDAYLQRLFNPHIGKAITPSNTTLDFLAETIKEDWLASENMLVGIYDYGKRTSDRFTGVIKEWVKSPPSKEKLDRSYGYTRWSHAFDVHSGIEQYLLPEDIQHFPTPKGMGFYDIRGKRFNELSLPELHYPRSYIGPKRMFDTTTTTLIFKRGSGALEDVLDGVKKPSKKVEKVVEEYMASIKAQEAAEKLIEKNFDPNTPEGVFVLQEIQDATPRYNKRITQVNEIASEIVAYQTTIIKYWARIYKFIEDTITTIENEVPTV